MFRRVQLLVALVAIIAFAIPASAQVEAVGGVFESGLIPHVDTLAKAVANETTTMTIRFTDADMRIERIGGSMSRWQGVIVEDGNVLGEAEFFTHNGRFGGGYITTPVGYTQVYPNGGVRFAPQGAFRDAIVPGGLVDKVRAAEAALAEAVSTTGPVTLEIGIFYSKCAATEAGGAQAVQDMIASAGTFLDGAFRDSGIDRVSFKIVGGTQIAFDENGKAKASYFSHFTKKFRDLRKKVKADLMIAVVCNPGDGLAGFANQYDGDSRYAYGVVSVDFFEFALLHEAGHLLGAYHEYTYLNCLPGLDESDFGKEFYTVMNSVGVLKLPSDCWPMGLLRFSNTKVKVEGFLAGTATYNNANRTNKNINTVSGWSGKL